MFVRSLSNSAADSQATLAECCGENRSSIVGYFRSNCPAAGAAVFNLLYSVAASGALLRSNVQPLSAWRSGAKAFHAGRDRAVDAARSPPSLAEAPRLALSHCCPSPSSSPPLDASALVAAVVSFGFLALREECAAGVFNLYVGLVGGGVSALLAEPGSWCEKGHP